MTIEDARRRAIDLVYSPINKPIINYYNKQGYNMEWQPIETASKDKLVLIAYYWKKGHDFYKENEEWSIILGIYNDERYIDVAHLDLQEMDAKWLPLPKPPKS